MRAIFPELPVHVFSDGHEHELANIMEIDGVSLRREPNDVADLLALAQAGLLIGSNSTFSRWAAFLGDMPSVWPNNKLREKPTGETTPILYVTDDFKAITREAVTPVITLRRTNLEQRKLIFSLGANFLTRVPGAIGLLWFLPLLRFGLGTDDYANLLTSMALGSAAAFLSGGFSVVGRRLIGEAYSGGDRAGEADGFASLVVANVAALSVALAIIAAYCLARGAGTSRPDRLDVSGVRSFPQHI